MYCKNCGVEIDENAFVCIKCGYQNGTGENYCAHCGSKVNKGAQNNYEKSNENENQGVQDNNVKQQYEKDISIIKKMAQTFLVISIIVGVLNIITEIGLFNVMSVIMMIVCMLFAFGFMMYALERRKIIKRINQSKKNQMPMVMSETKEQQESPTYNKLKSVFKQIGDGVAKLNEYNEKKVLAEYQGGKKAALIALVGGIISLICICF